MLGGESVMGVGVCTIPLATPLTPAPYPLSRSDCGGRVGCHRSGQPPPGGELNTDPSSPVPSG